MVSITNMRECLHIHLTDIYVITKFILPSIGNLDFSRLDNDNTSTYLDDRNIYNADTVKYLLDLLVVC